ncbi:MAG: hypothetical protein LBM38_01825 [Clostridiales bacterium]|jgi:hypothetical protein|nr:hypothetical protein [Clostridiales bacterium]
MSRKSWRRAYKEKYGVTPEERKQLDLARKAKEANMSEDDELENSAKQSTIPGGNHGVGTHYGSRKIGGVEYDIYCAKNLKRSRREFVLVGWQNAADVKEQIILGTEEHPKLIYLNGVHEVKATFDIPFGYEREVGSILFDCKSLNDAKAQIDNLKLRAVTNTKSF